MSISRTYVFYSLLSVLRNNLWNFKMSCYSIICTSHSTSTPFKRFTIYIYAVNCYQ
nr:MAG TPA: hypothetical protein [Caudoviricetes sp.]